VLCGWKDVFLVDAAIKCAVIDLGVQDEKNKNEFPEICIECLNK